MILRRDVLERSPSFGLSILTSTHVSKEAGESTLGGLFTVELLKALRGELLINDTQPLLSLGEIVRKLTSTSSLGEQAPNFCDLNLSGADFFCKNTRFNPTSSAETPFGSFRYPKQHPTLSETLLKGLWRNYLDLPKTNLADLSPFFQQAIDELSVTPESVESASLAIAQSFATRVQMHEDTFAAAVIRAMMVRALLAHRHIHQCRKAIAAHLPLVYAEAGRALTYLHDQLGSEHYSLVGRGGLADLYYLPLRLARVLGWIGLLMQESYSMASGSLSLARLRELTRSLLKQYGNSIVPVGEDQAAALLLFLAQCKRHDWTDEGEEIVGRLYYDFNGNFGRVLINDPTAVDVVEYLLAKADKPLDLDSSYVQRPSELFAVIFVGAAMFDLDEEIDCSLIQIDHTSFSFYIPESYADFWREDMETGLTIVFQLGHGLAIGHGVWSVGDMRRNWRHEIVPLTEAARAECDETELIAATLMSLISPDRLAWFVVPPIASRASTFGIAPPAEAPSWGITNPGSSYSQGSPPGNRLEALKGDRRG